MARRQKSRDPKEQFTFKYRVGVRITLIVITLLLAALIPVTAMDRTAWLKDIPVIAIVLVPIVLYFLFILLTDTNQTVFVGRDSIVSTSGVGPFRKTVELPFEEIVEFHDDTTLFSVGRKYSLIAAGEGGKRIRLNGALARYRELLGLLLKRIPRGRVSARAIKSLQRSRIIV